MESESKQAASSSKGDEREAPFTEIQSDVESGFHEGERMLARIWRLIALRGLAAVVFGFVLIVWPDIGLAAMIVVIGALAITHGFMTGVATFALPEGSSHRFRLGLEAIASTGIGIAVLVWPDLSAKALLYLVAAWAIAIGVMQVGASILLPLSGGWRVLIGLGGIVFTAFGFVMFVEPGAGAVAALALIAALAIVAGSFDLALALELRRAAGDLKDRIRGMGPMRSKPVVHG